MADIIALESEAKSIGQSSNSVTDNKACTKAIAIALNCDVAGTYDNNLLICLKDLSPATFTVTLNKYLLNTTTPASLCNTTGQGSYVKGSTATITAIASPGYEFIKWSDGNTNATRTVSSNTTLSAYFVVNYYKKIYTGSVPTMEWEGGINWGVVDYSSNTAAGISNILIGGFDICPNYLNNGNINPNLYKVYINNINLGNINHYPNSWTSTSHTNPVITSNQTYTIKILSSTLSSYLMCGCGHSKNYYKDETLRELIYPAGESCYSYLSFPEGITNIEVSEYALGYGTFATVVFPSTLTSLPNLFISIHSYSNLKQRVNLYFCSNNPPSNYDKAFGIYNNKVNKFNIHFPSGRLNAFQPLANYLISKGFTVAMYGDAHSINDYEFDALDG